MMAENYPHLVKMKPTYSRNTTPSKGRRNMKKTRHIIVKFLKAVSKNALTKEEKNALCTELKIKITLTTPQEKWNSEHSKETLL